MVKGLIVDGLERLCSLTHPVLHRRPFLWFGRVCWLASWSDALDQRWQTNRWGEP